MATAGDNWLLDGLLRLACQQWAALGAPLEADDPPEAVIDPEALLWFTLEVGRYDPRLFAEAVDWLEQNHLLVSILRLNRLGPDQGDLRWRILSAVAAKVSRKARSVKWRRLAGEESCNVGTLLEKAPLFLNPDGRALSAPSAEDPDFGERGLAVSRFVTRGRAGRPALTVPAALLLRGRALFGNNAGAEVWAALLTRTDAFESSLAELAGYGKIGGVLRRFVNCGICRDERRPHAKCYSLIHREHWKEVLSLPSFPTWPNWSRLFGGLVHLWRTSVELKRKDPSPYILASELRRAFLQARDDLVLGELGVTAPNPELYFTDEFLRRLQAYLRELLDNALFLPKAR